MKTLITKKTINIYLIAILLLGVIYLVARQLIPADEQLPYTDTRIAVSGKLFDDTTSKAIPEAKVTYFSGNPRIQPIVTTSGTLGEFNAELPDDTTYNLIKIEKDGYKTIDGTFQFRSQTSRPEEIAFGITLIPGEGNDIIHLQTIMPGENQISLPVVPLRQNPLGIFQYVSYGQNSTQSQKKYLETRGLLSRYDNALKSVIVYQLESADFGNIEAGVGYTYVHSGANPVTVQIRGNISPERSVSLGSAGWSFVGFPLRSPISQYGVWFKSNEELINFDDVLERGIVTDFKWMDLKLNEGLDTVDPQRTFWPGQGFWINTTQNDVSVYFRNNVYLSNLNKVYKDDNTFEISFDTNVPARAKVMWGETNQYGNTIVNNSLETHHVVNMALSPGVTGLHFNALAFSSIDGSLPPVDDLPPVDRGNTGSDETGDETVTSLKIVDFGSENLTETSVKLMWETNIPSTAFLNYFYLDDGGEANEYPEVIMSIADTKHSIVLDNLVAGETYRAEVEAKSADKTMRASQQFLFHVKKSYGLSCEAISKIEDGKWVPDDYKAQLNCTTTAPTKGEISIWSKTFGEDTQEVKFDELTTSFSHIFNVNDETRYEFNFEVMDEEGNFLDSKFGSFTTPVLSIGSVSVDFQPLVIRWTTNFAAQGSVEMVIDGQTRSFPSTWGKEHSVNLSTLDLDEETTYSYIIKSVGLSTKEKTATGSFTTLKVITRYSVIGMGGTIMVSVETSEPTTCDYIYTGPFTGRYRFETLHTWHSASLANMPQGVYNYRIECTTQWGMTGEVTDKLIYFNNTNRYSELITDKNPDTGNITVAFNAPYDYIVSFHIDGYVENYYAEGGYPDYLNTTRQGYDTERRVCDFEVERSFTARSSGEIEFSVPCSGARYRYNTWAITTTGEYLLKPFDFSDYHYTFEIEYPAVINLERFSFGIRISYARQVSSPEWKNITIAGSYKGYAPSNRCAMFWSPQDGGIWTIINGLIYPQCPSYWSTDTGIIYSNTMSPSNVYTYQYPNSQRFLRYDSVTKIYTLNPITDSDGPQARGYQFWPYLKTIRPFFGGPYVGQGVCFGEGSDPTSEKCLIEPPKFTY